MSIDNYGHEHEFEPQYGLPERLPADEKILWQASPDVAMLAREAFHFRTLCVYFASLVAIGGGMEISEGGDALAVLLSVKWLLPLSLTGLAIVWALAWMTARTTVYTLTNKRIVMRLGIVLTVTFNLPLSKLSGADLRLYRRGFGDISMSLTGEDRIAWVHLWPSSRPWHLANPQPTVRCVAGAASLSEQLSGAWALYNGNPTAASTVTASNAGEPVRASKLVRLKASAA
jgi:hypothetical protein